jgi:hypothetical protein
MAGRGGDATVARRRWLVAALLMLAVAVTVTEFDSRASILVLVAAFGALAVAARLPRVVAVGMIGAVVLIAFVFPLVAPDGAAIERIRGHRMANWRVAAERIGDRPLLGWGMDASRALPGGKSLINDLYPEGDDQQPCGSLAAPSARRGAVMAARTRPARHPARPRRAHPCTLAPGAGIALRLAAPARLRQAWWLSTLWLGAALLARLGAGPQGLAFQPDRRQRQPRQAHV